MMIKLHLLFLAYIAALPTSSSSSSSLCDSLLEDLGAGECSDLSPTSFRLEARSGGCLTYGGFTFDDVGEGTEHITAQNVCRLALYGDRAPSYDRPAATTGACRLRAGSASAASTVMMPHWFGRKTVTPVDTQPQKNNLIS
jgi:hypothetical protein